jgi:hypothetical protein
MELCDLGDTLSNHQQCGTRPVGKKKEKTMGTVKLPRDLLEDDLVDILHSEQDYLQTLYHTYPSADGRHVKMEELMMDVNSSVVMAAASATATIPSFYAVLSELCSKERELNPVGLLKCKQMQVASMYGRPPALQKQKARQIARQRMKDLLTQGIMSTSADDQD